MLSPGSGSGGPDRVTGASLPSARTRKSRLPSALAVPSAGCTQIRAPST
jgi:hypothetical protein